MSGLAVIGIKPYLPPGPPPPPASAYILQEDAASKFTLEDASGALLAETGSDTKISAFTDGNPTQPANDNLVAARGAGNVRLPVTNFVAVKDRVTADNGPNATTTETALYTATIPANTLGTDRCLRITLIGVLDKDVLTDVVTLRVKFGGATIYADVCATTGSAVNRPWCAELYLAGDGATNAQVLGGWFLLGDLATATTGLGDLQTDEVLAHTPILATAAIDSTADQTLTVTAQWSAAFTNVMTCRYACLERL